MLVWIDFFCSMDFSRKTWTEFRETEKKAWTDRLQGILKVLNYLSLAKQWHNNIFSPQVFLNSIFKCCFYNEAAYKWSEYVDHSF